MSKPKSSHRVFSREFKLGIVRRMLAGGNVSTLAPCLTRSSRLGPTCRTGGNYIRDKYRPLAVKTAKISQ